MGMYINPGNEGFKGIVRGKYVDKSGLIAVVNETLETSDRLTCISRPRRFGKSFAAQMLCAYYDRSCDSRELFRGLEIEQDPSFGACLNRYHVLCLDMTGFYTYRPKHVVTHMVGRVLQDLRLEFPELPVYETLEETLTALVRTTGIKVIAVIDEWDAVFREEKDNQAVQEAYIHFLRGLFKNSNLTNQVFAGVYMTGILPIKKYGTQSAVSDFLEYTMLNPGPFASYIGFTEEEVRSLCECEKMDFQQMKQWYDGYREDGRAIYNPNSVMKAIRFRRFDSYWSQTETYEALRQQILLNFNGLKDMVTRLLGGSHIAVNPRRFQNDMTSMASSNDVLTLLIHLGYLAYDSETETVHIPNLEIIMEFRDAMEDGGWEKVIQAVQESDRLLKSTLSGDEQEVARILERVHEENTSILKYNDENSLSCVISLAYYSARKDYMLQRELPAGKGFADIVLLPIRSGSSVPVLIELKYDESADAAIRQIHEKRYTGALSSYPSCLIVGINYDPGSKKHTCRIERVEMAR